MGWQPYLARPPVSKPKLGHYRQELLAKKSYSTPRAG